MKEDNDEHKHRFCVSAGWMRLEYLRSKDYTVCDGDGAYNPHGKFVRRPSGKIEEIKGQCSFEFIDNPGHPSHGKPNPDWDGCPNSEFKNHVIPPPTQEEILEPIKLEPPTPAPNAIDPEKKKRKSQTLSEKLEEILASR